MKIPGYRSMQNGNPCPGESTDSSQTISVGFRTKRMAQETAEQLASHAPDPKTRAAAGKIDSWTRAVLDSLSAHIAVLDRHGTIVAVNSAWEQFARDNQGDALRCNVGANYLDVCRTAVGATGKEASQVLVGLRGVLNATVDQFTIEYPCHSGTQERWFIFQATPLCDERGGVVVSHTQITARKQAEMALRESEECFRKIFENAATGIAITDMNCRYEQCNAAFCAIVGYSERELQQLDVAALVHPEDRQHNLELLHQLKDGEIPSFEIENRLVGRHGETIWVTNFASILHDDKGMRTHFIALVTNITARRQAEKSIRDREERMRAILNTASDAIITIDNRGIIQSLNPATETMFGYTGEELLGHNVNRLMPEPDRHALDGYLTRYCESGEASIIGKRRELVGRRKDGSVFPIAVTVSKVDHLELFTSIIRDISAVRELQRQVLEIAAEENRRIGHELHDDIQQQLTGLGLLARSLADALQQNVRPEADVAARLATGINESARDVHMLARGLVPVQVDARGLQAALSDLVSTIREQYGVEGVFACESPVELVDNFVATHLYRIAQEAVNNAIKHSQTNRIEISLSTDDQTITLTIADNGIGIGDRSMQGCGMGLQIMQYRAALIGGTLQIRPLERQGTRVICTIQRERIVPAEL